MKINRIAIIVMTLGILAVCNLSFAAQAQKTDSMKKPSATAQVAAGEVEITGVIKQEDKGFLLINGTQTYLLKGDTALEPLIGKLVKVRGELEQTRKGQVLTVKKAVISQ